jgi:hypothetical protein
MTTTTMSTAQVAELVTGHITGHGLPEPVSLLLIMATFDRPDVRVQVDHLDLASTAATLLGWATTFPAVALRAWRPADGTSVHLHVDTTLTGPAGDVTLTVYGGTVFDPVAFADLQPGQTCPVSLGQLTAWANGVGTEVAA